MVLSYFFTNSAFFLLKTRYVLVESMSGVSILIFIPKFSAKIGAEKILSEKIGKAEQKEIITTLDFRGERLFLPEVISKITKFNDRDNYTIKAQKGKLNIEEFK